MTKRKWLLVVGALVVMGAGVFAHDRWNSQRASAQAPAAPPRLVSVAVATATKDMMPVRLESLGSVTTIASVAIKARIDSEIVGIHFTDGAKVNAGDVLITLDRRAVEAQIKQVEGNMARDQAQIDGAERDVRRYTELVARGATPVVNLDNAKTQAETFRANLRANQAALENLNVQLSYCTIRAPISGRISTAAFKVGSLVRQADVLPIAVINQISPIYVSFTTPQRSLPDVRQALAAETATVEAIIPGEARRAPGTVTVIENAVDASTGMVTIRATMPNTDELLWPGTLVTAQMTLRNEPSVVVPSVAVQVSQAGSFVFVINDGVANVRPVKVDRTVDQVSVISSGLNGGEMVVTDGHLLLNNGTRVSVREPRPGT